MVAPAVAATVTVMVMEADAPGASVSDAFGVPLAFNTYAARACGVLASTPGIHAAAVARLAGRAAATVGRT